MLLDYEEYTQFEPHGLLDDGHYYIIHSNEEFTNNWCMNLLPIKGLDTAGWGVQCTGSRYKCLVKICRSPLFEAEEVLFEILAVLKRSYKLSKVSPQNNRCDVYVANQNPHVSISSTNEQNI